MIDDNPYSPPKSEDFRLPENNYQPTKGQRITRIIMCFVLMWLIFIIIFIVSGGLGNISEWVFTAKEMPFETLLVVFHLSIRFLVSLAIPLLIFSILNEYLTILSKSNFWYLFIYILVNAILISLSVFFFDFILDKFFSWRKWLVITFHFEFSFYNLNSLFSIWYITIFIVELILNIHYKYYAKKSFQVA